MLSGTGIPSLSSFYLKKHVHGSLNLPSGSPSFWEVVCMALACALIRA